MGRSKKTETAQTEETVVADVQVGRDITLSDSISEQETQPSNEIEELEEIPEIKKPSETKKTSPKSEPIEKISSRDMELMRLYPQYEKLWITPKGFVHPEGAPKYLLKGAKLFTNKFFNNKQ